MTRRRKDQRRCSQISVRVHPEAQPWVIPPDRLSRLACMLGRDVTVEYWPRRMVGQIWKRDHGGKPLPVHPYAFRAYSRGNQSVLFVDDTETPASATWLLLHELAHVDLAGARLVHRAYRSMPHPPGYLTTDEGHEAHPEEQLANATADRIFPQLGYPAQSLNRLWWRRRVNARRRT
jgi:hypothetical protein